MGRHSAPDEDDDASLAEQGAPEHGTVALRKRTAPAPSPGRHYRGDDDAEPETPPAVVVDRPPPTGLPVTDTAPRRVASPQVVVKHAAHNSAADLALVRSHRGVLVLCLLAVLIPFAVDVAVLLALDEFTGRRFLVWIWAPLIAAGVLIGLVLDIAHRRQASRATPVSG